MADVIPFTCLRPAPQYVEAIAALPYDVYTREEAAREIEANPLSFLRIDKPAATLPPEVGEYDRAVYEAAREQLKADIKDDLFIHSQLRVIPYYYLYRLISPANEATGRPVHEQTAVMACVSIDDYLNDVIKRHENTREHKQRDRVDHITALRAHTGPVFLTYRPSPMIDEAVNDTKEHAAPLYDFTSVDGIRHTVWRVDDPRSSSAIRAGFKDIDALYIADGHHRAAAAVAVGQVRKGDSDHFLAALFPANQVDLLDYNRVVFDLNGLDVDAFKAALTDKFELEPLQIPPSSPGFRPTKPGEFNMYLGGDGCDGGWYRLTIDEALRPADPVGHLDVSLLQEHVLGPVLGIGDPRSSSRIAYVGGAFGAAKLEERVQEKTALHPAEPAVAFMLFACGLDDFFAVADAGRLMPPKSTWFEPKPRSGLFIHRF
jgi:uncharacterized protein (DUF1015 family)